MGVLKNNRYSSVTVHSRVILLFITLHFGSSIRSRVLCTQKHFCTQAAAAASSAAHYEFIRLDCRFVESTATPLHFGLLGSHIGRTRRPAPGARGDGGAPPAWHSRSRDRDNRNSSSVQTSVRYSGHGHGADGNFCLGCVQIQGVGGTKFFAAA